MTRRALKSLPAALLPMLASGLLSTGCPSSGLDPYNTKDDEETLEEVDPPRPAEDPPHIENCPTLCAQAMLIYAPLGCDLSCDINLGTTVEAELDVAVINLLTLVWVDAEGSYQTGETCDIAVSCPGLTPCQSLALTCFNDSSNTPEYCMEQYVQCEQESLCSEVFNECASQAWDAYEDCTGTTEECQDLLENLNDMCSEQYADCVDIAEDAAPLPPLPRRTATHQYEVPRAFLKYHLRRLETLALETFTMLMPGPDGTPLGLAVYSIESGDPLALLGIENGDIVTAVNGTPIMSFASKLEVLLEFARGSGIELSIVRKGKARSHRYRWVD